MGGFYALSFETIINRSRMADMSAGEASIARTVEAPHARDGENARR
jgi:hypothetical protein